ncbi:hypothetical protein SLOPH_852 [Spraguea lophii 42_110]|uniref:Uncharacterized protein n=1 Tax=Spraguea lophii (strain 42_110) TaxID=1358809 RepID=S7W8M2_SPRLO|nr:hypothetical protein SLOPH_852 [Spraguea lophii 42_110]
MLINNVDHLSIVCTGFTIIDFDEKKSNKINISRYMKYIELKENGVDIKIPFFRRVLFKDYVVCLVCKSFYQNFVINDGDKLSFILGDKKGFKSKENRLELYHKRSNNNYMENIVSIKIKSQSDTSIKLGLFLLTQKLTVKILNSVIDFILGNV